MPELEAPCVELGTAPETPSIMASPSPSEISSASTPEPQNVRATPLFRMLAMPPPEPEQPPGQDELERRLLGYRRIVIPRDLTLIELLKQYSGVTTDEEVLRIREAKLKVVAERVGLRRLHVLAPLLRSLTLDGSAISSLRDLGIGLIHLKILSVNRCGLTSLDGVWGLGALRELFVAGNQLLDLHPLGALQKLNTLDLANNPISDSGRLWTLGVCGSLRKLILRGTPAADNPQYRSRVASLLPMLVYLDDNPLHTDIQCDAEDEFGNLSSGSDGNEETYTRPNPSSVTMEEPRRGLSITHSQDILQKFPKNSGDNINNEFINFCRRPATTENAGIRPRLTLRPRPRTAHGRPDLGTMSRLYMLNTLMDEEWQCNGSKLTSQTPVCGNLARALRRSSNTHHQEFIEADLQFVDETVAQASRAVAAEIPRVSLPEDWAEFRLKTGIEIDIAFNVYPVGDPSRAIERLEQIEKETQERLKREETNDENISKARSVFYANHANLGSSTSTNDYDLWSREEDFFTE